MLTKEDCEEGFRVAIPTKKSYGQPVAELYTELARMGYSKPYLVVHDAVEDKENKELQVVNLRADIGFKAEYGRIVASKYSSDDLEPYRNGYWDVAFRVGDVLLLDNKGREDAGDNVMIERCESIIRDACKDFGLEVPELPRYFCRLDETYDSVNVRDFYIDQLRPLFANNLVYALTEQ